MTTTSPTHNNSSNEQTITETSFIPADGLKPGAEHLPESGVNGLHLEPTWDPATVLKHLSILFEPGQLFEIRALEVFAVGFPYAPGTKGSTASGVFASPSDAAQALTFFLERYVCKGVYVTLNPLDPAKRPPSGRIDPYCESTAKDGDILSRRWLLIDCDPVRASGSNSSESELKAALEKARRIRDYLTEKGLPPPVELMSGNGAHLLYHVDLQRDDNGLVKRFLMGLSNRFDDVQVKVDTAVCNPARITKLAGTLARKDSHTEERPCRLSALCSPASAQEEFIPRSTSSAQLESIVTENPSLTTSLKQKKTSRNYSLSQLPRIEKECAFMAHCRDTGAELTEALWYSQLSIIVRTENGDELAHERSSSHAGYSRETTDAKLRHALAAAGPQTCDYIQNGLGFKGCSECPHNGKITSPIQLGKVEVSKGNAIKADELSALGIEDPKGFLQVALNDDGNASRFLAVHGEDVNFCPDMGRWLVWDGMRWAEDGREIILEKAATAMQAFQTFVADLVTDSPELHRYLKPFSNFANDSGNVPKLKAMLTLAASRKSVRKDELDSDNWLLNVENGTLDLRTGTLEPHDRKHLITKLARVRYVKDASSAVWEKHLHVIFGGNTRMAEYLRRWAGCCLTGDISVRAFAVLHGSGCNGKSVTTETLRTLLGDYAVSTDPSTFENQKGSNKIRSDLARLRGARLVVSSETNLGSKLDPGLVKRMTGGEEITARFLYGADFSFQPIFKMMMSTNNKPSMPGNDPAIWSRVKLISFENTIPPDQIDPDLGAKLRSAEALSGILAWAVQGCLDFQENGLQDPPEVTEAVSEYREDLDFLSQWLESQCVVSKADEKYNFIEPYQRLYLNFQNWCKEFGAPEISGHGFQTFLKSKGFENVKRNNQRFRIGIRLRSSVPFHPLSLPKPTEQSSEGWNREDAPDSAA